MQVLVHRGIVTTEGLILHYRAPRRTAWNINGLLTQEISLWVPHPTPHCVVLTNLYVSYRRLFNRKRWAWVLRTRSTPLERSAASGGYTREQLAAGSDIEMGTVRCSEQLFGHGQGTNGLVRVYGAGVEFQQQYNLLRHAS